MCLLIWGQGFPENSGDKWYRGCQAVTREDGKGSFHYLNTVPRKTKGLKRRSSEARENRDEVA